MENGQQQDRLATPWPTEQELVRSNTENFALIDLAALQRNAEKIRAVCQPAQLVAVLKANAYGLGLEEVYDALVAVGVQRFALANLNEAKRLHAHDALAEPHVMGYIRPERFQEAQQIPMIWSLISAEQWVLLKKALTKPIRAMIALDTGFHRIGFAPTEESLEVIADMAAHPLVTLTGMFSHLRLATEEQDREQCRRLVDFAKQLENRGVHIPNLQIADSIGAFRYPWARLDAVRIGAALFGMQADSDPDRGLEGTISLFCRVAETIELQAGESIGYDEDFIAQQDMCIATLSIGYADGLPRQLSQHGGVWIHGYFAPFVGLLCMDQAMVDVTHIPGVAMDDLALVYCADRRSAASVQILSQQAKTNKNEILSSLAARVPRFYRR